MNNGIYLGLLGIVIMLSIATIMDRIGTDDSDLNNLPPPAAGATSPRIEASKICEGVIFGISSDGFKYVRESGGGNVYASLVDGAVRYYKLAEYDQMIIVNHSKLNPESASHLKHSLLNCDAQYLPSGIRFRSSDG